MLPVFLECNELTGERISLYIRLMFDVPNEYNVIDEYYKSCMIFPCIFVL